MQASFVWRQVYWQTSYNLNVPMHFSMCIYCKCCVSFGYPRPTRCCAGFNNQQSVPMTPRQYPAVERLQVDDASLTYIDCMQEADPLTIYSTYLILELPRLGSARSRNTCNLSAHCWYDDAAWLLYVCSRGLSCGSCTPSYDLLEPIWDPI